MDKKFYDQLKAVGRADDTIRVSGRIFDGEEQAIRRYIFMEAIVTRRAFRGFLATHQPEAQTWTDTTWQTLEALLNEMGLIVEVEYVP